MKWMLLLASVILLSTSALAKPREDLSDPELINMYIWLDCEALEYSREVMRLELNRLSRRYIKCLSLQDTDALDNPFFGLHCVYTRQTFDFRYMHMMSVEVAYDLMCYEGGRKYKEYDIDF